LTGPIVLRAVNQLHLLEFHSARSKDGRSTANDGSSGKILNRRTRKVVNRAATALRNAATTLVRSQSYLGAQYRRLRTRLGAPKAITAMARKLASLFYRLIKHGQQYVDKGMEYYEQRHREQQIRSLLKRAQKAWFPISYPKDRLKVSGEKL